MLFQRREKEEGDSALEPPEEEGWREEHVHTRGSGVLVSRNVSCRKRNGPTVDITDTHIIQSVCIVGCSCLCSVVRLNLGLHDFFHS